MFLRDKVRTYVSIVTLQKLRQLGWKILTRSPYIPTMAPNDYNIFLALQNFFSDKKFESRENCVNRLQKFFSNRYQDYYENGMFNLNELVQNILNKMSKFE